MSHLMANRRFAILALIGPDGTLGPELMRGVADCWPTPIGRKAFGCEIAKLQHAGLVRSYAGRTRDGRSSLYRLTPAGEEFVHAHTAVLERLVRTAKRRLVEARELPDLHGMATAAMFVRKRAQYAAGPVRQALLDAANHLERMNGALGGV